MTSSDSRDTLLRRCSASFGRFSGNSIVRHLFNRNIFKNQSKTYILINVCCFYPSDEHKGRQQTDKEKGDEHTDRKLNERKSLNAGLKWSCLHTHSTRRRLFQVISDEGIRGYTSERVVQGYTAINRDL